MAQPTSAPTTSRGRGRGGGPGGRGGGGERGGDRRRRNQPERKPPTEEWIPRTWLGRQVKEGKITSIDDIFSMSYRVKESQIVDILLPDMKEEVVEIKMVQKQTDAGQQSRFKATVLVGNENGYVGLGEAKNKEIGPAIRKAIGLAKLHLIPVKRGCGSWECNCGGNHSIPYEVLGKEGSTQVDVIPAPKGVGLACADTVKLVLKLAGIKDVWTRTKGETRTTANLAKGTLQALREAYKVMSVSDWER
ncbi:MAG: 30S ribosomal protein S5 [Promethearchaeota archaeon CR_4]|nr:MAG: 30S ribosomal protein S5 [Candidatus Lokiarchaeota archaeon CR_4]